MYSTAVAYLNKRAEQGAKSQNLPEGRDQYPVSLRPFESRRKCGYRFPEPENSDEGRMDARAAVLSNLSRWVLWLKSWSGDTASKNKLCALTFHGQFIFGPDLDKILEKNDQKKGFPEEKTSMKRNRARMIGEAKGRLVGVTLREAEAGKSLRNNDVTRMGARLKIPLAASYL